jgi:hypothetical protein
VTNEDGAAELAAAAAVSLLLLPAANLQQKHCSSNFKLLNEGMRKEIYVTKQTAMF